MTSLYDKVKAREEQAEIERSDLERKQSRRVRQTAHHLEDSEESRMTMLAAIKASLWIAAAGPALEREAKQRKEGIRTGCDELNDAILRIEEVLEDRQVLPFRINDECRWNGRRIIASKDSHFTVLTCAPRSVRYAAIDVLSSIDLLSLRAQESR